MWVRSAQGGREKGKECGLTRNNNWKLSKVEKDTVSKNVKVKSSLGVKLNHTSPKQMVSCRWKKKINVARYLSLAEIIHQKIL